MKQRSISRQCRALAQMQLICHLPWDDFLAAHDPTFTQKFLPSSVLSRGMDVETGKVKNGSILSTLRCGAKPRNWGRFTLILWLSAYPKELGIKKQTKCPLEMKWFLIWCHKKNHSKCNDLEQHKFIFLRCVSQPHWFGVTSLLSLKPKVFFFVALNL